MQSLCRASGSQKAQGRSAASAAALWPRCAARSACCRARCCD